MLAFEEDTLPSGVCQEILDYKPQHDFYTPTLSDRSVFPSFLYTERIHLLSVIPPIPLNGI